MQKVREKQLFQIKKSEFQDLKTNDPIRFREDMLHNNMADQQLFPKTEEEKAFDKRVDFWKKQVPERSVKE